jgi:hypothetical protein
MNDRELNEVLKRATVPEREAECWERFPGRVTAELERRSQAAQAGWGAIDGAGAGPDAGDGWSWVAVLRSLVNHPAFALGMAAVCLVAALVLRSLNRRESPSYDPQLAEARKYFREIEGLFPRQLQAIVFDQQGAHLVLAQEANLPASPPLYLKIRGPRGCQRFVTFSGQQIHVNGDVCDVLADGQGKVLLVGRQLVWAGSPSRGTSSPYEIEARLLEAGS